MTELQYSAVYAFFVKQDHTLNGAMDCSEFLSFLKVTSAEEIWDVISNNRDQLPEITTKNIPQFSEKRDMYKALKVIIAADTTPLEYADLGYYLCKVDRKPEAKRKYAENQYMLAVQTGLAYERKPLAVTNLGRSFSDLQRESDKDKVLKRLCLGIPVMQQILLLAESQCVNVVTFLSDYLAPTTVLRRRSNVHTFLDWLRTISTGEIDTMINRIVW